MSADIIQFIPRPTRRRRPLESPAMMRSAFREDDLTMGHPDTAPCEYVVFDSKSCTEDEVG